MDPKGKAPTPIYDIINLEGHSKKQKAHVTDSFVVVRSPKEVKTIVMTGVETATTTMGVSMPVVVDDFDLADMEMAMRLREAAHLKPPAAAKGDAEEEGYGCLISPHESNKNQGLFVIISFGNKCREKTKNKFIGALLQRAIMKKRICLQDSEQIENSSDMRFYMIEEKILLSSKIQALLVITG
ncbi:hypothetical protein ACJX0J_036850, partial [Zea mays]